jgi:hypothetical protein
VELKERHVLCQISHGRVHRLHPAHQRLYLLGERIDLGVGEKSLCSSTVSIAVAVLVSTTAGVFRSARSNREIGIIVAIQ